MAKLAGSRAIVTGAGSGIGKAIAVALVERGASVVLADIDGDAAIRLAAELGTAATALRLDVTDHAAVDALLAAIPAAFRPIELRLAHLYLVVDDEGFGDRGARQRTAAQHGGQNAGLHATTLPRDSW